MIRVLSAFLAAVALAGCGGGSDGKMKPLDMGGEDGTKISTLIEDLNEAKGTPKKFNALFAKGSAPAPADAKKFAPYSFYIATGTKPTASGDEGTAKVSIHDDKQAKEVAQKDWAFIKDGNAWKIKSAQLP